jgi:hypothetical protein
MEEQGVPQCPPEFPSRAPFLSLSETSLSLMSSDRNTTHRDHCHYVWSILLCVPNP